MGDERVVDLLLEDGASPDLEDQYGWTPLARAVENGEVAILQLLLSRGAKKDYKYDIVSESHHI